MYEEHACKFYKAQTHCSCWIHLRWSRVLDTSGEKYKKLITYYYKKIKLILPLTVLDGYVNLYDIYLYCFRMGPSHLKILLWHLMNMMCREWCAPMKTLFPFMFIVVKRESGSRYKLYQFIRNYSLSIDTTWKVPSILLQN